MQKLLIVGAGGFAREVLWAFREDNKLRQCWDILGFIDEDAAKHGNIYCDATVLGGFEWLEKSIPSDIKLISGVGNPKTKRRFFEKSNHLGFGFCTLVAPDVKKSPYVEIGEGTIITAGNIITTQVKIGRQVTVNLNCTIGHDVIIEDYCTIAPGVNISGNVKIREGAKLGTGVTVLPGLTVGRWSVVGAGGVVTRDIPDHVIAVGIPARVIRST